MSPWIPYNLHEKSSGCLLLPQGRNLIPFISLVKLLIFKWFPWNSHGTPWMQWGFWKAAQLSLPCPRLMSPWPGAMAQGQMSRVSGHGFAWFLCGTMENLLALAAKLLIFIEILVFVWKIMWIKWIAWFSLDFIENTMIQVVCPWCFLFSKHVWCKCCDIGMSWGSKLMVVWTWLGRVGL